MNQKYVPSKITEPSPMRLITTYGAQWGSVRKALEKNWNVLLKNKNIAKIVGERPKMVAQRSKSLGDILIHSEFTKQQNSTWLSKFPRSRGMFLCTKCQICPFVERTDTFRDAKGEKEYEIRELINCSTSKVVYMITCPCPKKRKGREC